MFDNLTCTDFIPLLSQGVTLTLANKDGEPMVLNLWTVIGEGADIQFIFKGAKTGRFSIGVMYDKTAKIREFCDSLLSEKNRDSGFSLVES